jgi:tetratricopeptide (TPR) repeat protein
MQNQKSIFGVVIILSVLVVSMFLANFGCVPPAPNVDPVRQKAVQDSIREVNQKKYLFDLDKNWSTGYEYHKSGMFRQAIKPFWRVAQIDTIQRYKLVWSKLVDAYFKLNVVDSAEIACQQGLQQYPDNTYLLRNMAHILGGRDMTEEAIKYYEKIVELEPEALDDWKKLGSLRLKNNLVDEAITAYEKASALKAEDQESNEVLTKLYAQTGNDDAALERLEKLRLQDPTNTKHMFSLGRQYFQREMWSKAEPEFREYLKLNADDVYAAELFGSSFQNQNKFEEAIKVHEDILKRKPDNKKSYCEIASCLKSLKRYRQARESVRQALKIDGAYGYAFLVLGEIYEATAESCMEEGKRTAPTFDDKLIYQLAYDQYVKAAEDPASKSFASRRIDYVKQMTPAKEDLFMNKGKIKARGACYAWIY